MKMSGITWATANECCVFENYFYENVCMNKVQLTYTVRGCIFDVFRELGPGLIESVYEAALRYELEKEGLKVRSQVGVPVIYKNSTLDLGFRIDLLVEDDILIEVKSVEAITDVHLKQLHTYLRVTRCGIGFLINFNVAKLEDKCSLIRVANLRLARHENVR
jgi:GxxExxY protein